MTSEERKLLLQDLSARLPYGVVIDASKHPALGNSDIKMGRLSTISYKNEQLVYVSTEGDLYLCIDYVRPYLRPMSSMTEEEKKSEPGVTSLDGFMFPDEASNYIDWLNAHQFDYRGLIEAGLAIKVTEENNPYKK